MPSFLRVRGIVIHSSRHKESDRVIRILTQHDGLIRATAPGAAKSGSRFAYAAQPLMLCDFVLSTSHDFYYLKEVEIVYSFQNIQEDIIRLTAAAHVLEIANDISFDKESATLLYPLLLYTLTDLNKKDKDYRLTVCTFEWKATDISGFSADLFECEAGGTATQNYLFSFETCRVYCGNTGSVRNADVFQFISSGTLQALRYIYEADNEKLFSYTVSPGVLSEMEHLTRRYLSERLEKKYTKMDMLQDLPEL
jgi:DNA repair protein RecO (recombination protein O)